MAKQLEYEERVYTKDDVKVVVGRNLPSEDEPYKYLYIVCPMKGCALPFFHYKMPNIDIPVQMPGIEIDYFDEEGE